MIKNLLFNAQLSGADRIAGAQKYMGRSMTFDDYAVIFSIIFMLIGFGILVGVVYIKQKEKRRKTED